MSSKPAASSSPSGPAASHAAAGDNAQPSAHHNAVDVLGTGRFMRLVSRHREQGTWEYAERLNVTGIVTIAAGFEGQIVLVEQFRVPVQRRVIELPAGLAGDLPGTSEESMELAASRELEEETGFHADKWELISTGPTSAGMTTEIISFFRATQLRRVSEGGGDGTEEITVHLVPYAQAPAWLRQQEAAGKMVDAKVFAGLYLLQQPELA